MIDLQLARSEWSRPVPGLADRAFEFHLGGLIRWLGVAGAEPRLALVLVSGPRARRRMVEALHTSRIEVVEAPATPARPVHARIGAHQGDHFNRTLFLVGGLDEAGDPTALLEGLEAGRTLMRRMATWVAVVVESARTLALLDEAAPALERAFMHRCLLLDAEMVTATAAPEPRADTWRADGRVHEVVYHHGMTAQAPPRLADFDRLVRSGYGGALDGLPMHPERQRLVELWAGRDVQLAQAGPAAAEAAARQRGLDDPRCAALLADDPAARAAAGLPVDDVPSLARWQRVEAMGRGEAPVDAQAIEVLAALGRDADAGPGLKVHAALAAAAAQAAREDLAGCAAALAEADAAGQAPGVAPELAFEVAEARLRLQVFASERGDARETLDRLERLAPRLCSPLYAARALQARGEFIAPLDAGRARSDFVQAATLFETHGYPDRAAAAREML